MIGVSCSEHRRFFDPQAAAAKRVFFSTNGVGIADILFWQFDKIAQLRVRIHTDVTAQVGFADVALQQHQLLS